jgi:hypothetical protein
VWGRRPIESGALAGVPPARSSAPSGEREEVMGVVEWVGDEPVPQDLEACILQQLQVGGRVEVAPEHRSTKVGVAILGEIACAETEQRETAGAQNPSELSENSTVIRTGNVDHRVVGDDGFEAAVAERESNEIRLHKSGLGHARSRKYQLDPGQVETNRLETGFDEPGHDRDAATAARVQDESLRD